MSRKFPTARLALGLVVFAHACTIRDVTEVQVSSVEVQPSSLTILEGETQHLTAQVKDESGQPLPTGTVTWSSDAPSVFSVDSKGTGQALAPGQATVWATLSGARGSGIVSVEPGPSIVVSEPSLLFSGTVGGTAPDPITLEITNGGGGSVGGISASLHYPEGGATGWLSLALAGTSAPTTLTVTGLLGLLEEGTHEATLVLASQDDRISPVTVPVQAVVVLDKPIIGLSSRALEFRAEAAGAPPAPQTVRVTNEGGGVLSDLQVTTLYEGVGSWLSVSLAGTTAPAELTVQPDPSGLSPGIHTAEVRVTGPGALNTPLSVEVTFTIDVGAGESSQVHGHRPSRHRGQRHEDPRPGQERERLPVDLRGRYGGHDRVGSQRGRAHHGHRRGRWHLHRQLHAHRRRHRPGRHHDGRHAHQRQSLHQQGRCGEREPGQFHGHRSVRLGRFRDQCRGQGTGRERQRVDLRGRRRWS